MKKKSLGFIITVIFIGALIGSALGEIVTYLVPAGVVKDFFLKSVTASIGPGTLNIIIVTLTLGFTLKLNVMGVIGILIAAYVLRWVD
ncbi:MAG: DUF4321 domain-containing protein [Calditrichaceae bacterium]